MAVRIKMDQVAIRIKGIIDCDCGRLVLTANIVRLGAYHSYHNCHGTYQEEYCTCILTIHLKVSCHIIKMTKTSNISEIQDIIHISHIVLFFYFIGQSSSLKDI